MKFHIDTALLDPSAMSDETRAFNAAFVERTADMAPTHSVPPQVMRDARERGEGIFPPQGPDDGSYWVDVPGGQRARLSDAKAPRAIYLHIHGGGWTLGRPTHYDLINQELAAKTGCQVVSAEYRLAPENRWPACRDDCLTALRFAAETWPDLPILIGGESAGGHLASTVLVALRDDPLLTRIKGAILNYGCFDLRMTASAANWGETPLVLSTPTMAWFSGNMAPDAEMRASPEVSTLLAPLTDMPPALFQIGTRDPLLDDSLLMATRWVAEGNRAELAIYPGGIHAFDMFEIKIAVEFRARQIAFMQACLH